MKFSTEAPGTNSEELNSGGLNSGDRYVRSDVNRLDRVSSDILEPVDYKDAETRGMGRIPDDSEVEENEVGDGSQKPSFGKRLVNFLHAFGSRHSTSKSSIPWQAESTRANVVEEESEKPRVKPQINSNPENKRSEDKVEDTEEESVVPVVEEEKFHRLVAVKAPKITHSSESLSKNERGSNIGLVSLLDEDVVDGKLTDEKGDMVGRDGVYPARNLKPREVLKSENDFDKKKPKNKKDKPDPENTDVKEDPEDAQKLESKKTREEKELALARKLDKGAEAVAKVFGVFKDSLGRIVPEKVKDFVEARDVQKKVEKTEVFANREKALEEVVSLTHQITEKTSKIANIDSHIARENSALNDAKNELALRKQLAGDDSDLIVAAEETFKEHEASIAEKIADLSEQKVPLVAEKENLLKQKEASQALIRGDNERLRVLVDGRVENLKARVGHEQILANQENLSLELSTEKEKLRKLDAKISAYRATIERGGYTKEKVNSFKEYLKTMEGQAKLVRKAVSEYQKKFDQIRTVTETLDRRFKAMREVLRDMGVVDEKVKKPEEVKVTGQKTQTPDATQAKVTTPPTVTTSPQSQGPEQNANDSNDLPEDVYEKMFDGQPSVEEENFDRQREQMAQISKGRFDDLLKDVEKNQNRPKPDDVSKLIKFARDFIKEKILSPKLIETEVEELKNPQLKRDERIALLKQIQAKLNSPKK